MSLYADGRDFFEVMTEVIRAFARFAADLGEVSDEDYPAFEQAAIEEFFAGFNLEEEFLGEFTGHLGTYSIDGDTLSITTFEDGEADTIELRRIVLRRRRRAEEISPRFGEGPARFRWLPARNPGDEDLAMLLPSGTAPPDRILIQGVVERRGAGG